MPVRDIAARLRRQTHRASRIDIAVGEEAADLVAADRIPEVEVYAQVVLSQRRHDAGQREGAAPFRARSGRRGGRNDGKLPGREADAVEAAPGGELHPADEVGDVIAVGAEGRRLA